MLEYAALVWHPGLSRKQPGALEDFQLGACTTAMPHVDYDSAISSYQCAVNDTPHPLRKGG